MTVSTPPSEVLELSSEQSVSSNITGSVASNVNTQRSTYGRGGRGRGGIGFDRGGRHFFTRITNKDSMSTIPMMYSLSENPRRDQFIIFQQELEQHVFNEFEKSGDIVGLVTEMT